MKDILSAPFLKEFMRTTSNMYRLGYDERNGGNISMIIDEDEYRDYITGDVIRTIPLNFTANELIGKTFLVTGTGKYFKNIEYFPEVNLGLIRIAKDGCSGELLWGLQVQEDLFCAQYRPRFYQHILHRAGIPATDPAL